MVTPTPEALQRRSRSPSARASRVVTNHRAGPPTPNWLCRASGSWLRTPGTVSSQSPSDTLCLQGTEQSRRQPVESAEGEDEQHVAPTGDAGDQLDRLGAPRHHMDVGGRAD